MNKTIITFGIYGLIAGAILFLAALTLGSSLSYGAQEIIGYTTMVLSLSFVFFGIKQYRDKELNGAISFGKAFSVGVLISVFVGIGFGLIDALYTAVINPTFMEDYVSRMRAQGFEGEIPQWSSAQMALLMFVTVVLIGIIISLISALTLKREQTNQ